MKTFLATVALAFSLLSLTAHAQSGMSTENWKNIKFGPFFTLGAAVNAGEVADGSKTSPAFAWSAGALGYLPFSTNIGFQLGLAYDSRSINFHAESDENAKMDLTMNYFNLRPEFYLGGFLVGFGVGLPLGGTVKVNPAKAGISTDIKSDDMEMLLELRLGGSILAAESDLGQLKILVEGSYGLSKMWKSSSANFNSAGNNGPLATIQLGATYLFESNPH